MTRTPRKITAEWITAAAAIAALLASLYGAYLSNDKATSIATATVQAHEQDMSERMDRVENKVDRVDNKLDTLIYYITGVKPNGPR